MYTIISQCELQKFVYVVVILEHNKFNVLTDLVMSCFRKSQSVSSDVDRLGREAASDNCSIKIGAYSITVCLKTLAKKPHSQAHTVCTSDSGVWTNSYSCVELHPQATLKKQEMGMGTRLNL